MTIRDELVRAVGSVREADVRVTDSAAYDRAYNHAFDFIRNHGPALVEAVRDAERYQFLRDNEHGLVAIDAWSGVEHCGADLTRRERRAGSEDEDEDDMPRWRVVGRESERLLSHLRATARCRLCPCASAGSAASP